MSGYRNVWGNDAIWPHTSPLQRIGDVYAQLAAERARLRRWQLRLRWRKEWRAGTDRLTARALVLHGRIRYWALPIAGPRGVLP